MLTEEQAISRCLEHCDPRGFDDLVRRYRREALVHARALLGDEAEAEDACQDCFLKAFHAMPRLRRLDRFYPWFYRILRNHCLNLISRRGTRSRNAEAVARHMASASVRPDFGILAKERQDQVERALAAVSPEHREILLMRHVEELSYADLAVRLGIPRGTVMSRLYHARLAFKNLFGNEEDR
ncbi:MAG: RNA polymerase sigma factor [Lentisphaeria bacterium]|nr:RNA polymerase sigma factor [Lentisphaeria bacterium]